MLSAHFDRSLTHNRLKSLLARVCDVILLQTVKLFCAESLEVMQYDAATRQYQVRILHFSMYVCDGSHLLHVCDGSHLLRVCVMVLTFCLCVMALTFCMCDMVLTFCVCVMVLTLCICNLYWCRLSYCLCRACSYFESNLAGGQAVAPWMSATPFVAFCLCAFPFFLVSPFCLAFLFLPLLFLIASPFP